ncbi:MAG: flagellar hook capping FlgD N-terminal domain-containing protein [Roseibium sp.]
MTTISPNSSSTGAQGGSEESQKGLTANYELFLRILTTQIQNQDPLDPLDSAEYTSQLVQYTNVEQTIQTNKNLEQLIAMQQSSHTMNYVSYIGNEVTADASTAILSNGQASWSVDIDEFASGEYEIRNSAGEVVYKGETELKAGVGKFEWDGLTTSGAQAVDGSYSVQFNLKNGEGRPEPVSTVIKGIVDSVDWSSGDLFLKVGGRDIPVSSVKSVSRPS